MKGLFSSAVSSLKGRDLHQLVEDFTYEMTLVAEGFNEDLEQNAGELAQLSARQTVAEEGLRASGVKIDERLKTLEKRMDELEAVARKGTKAGVTSALRQATWLAGMLAAAWVITSLLKILGG